MSFFKITIIGVFFYTTSVCAGTINCEPQTSTHNNYNQWAEMHKNFEINSSKVNVTLGSEISDWSILYVADDIVIGNDAGTCNASGTSDYFTMLSQIAPISHQGNDYIYATNVPGIGISVAESYSSRYNSMQPYPVASYWGGATNGIGFHSTIKYWKIPNQRIPIDSGAITVIGPEFSVINEKSGYTFTSSDPSRITSDGKAYINGSRIIVATLLFQAGTCNIEGDNVNVNMGEYDGENGHSGWKDASFRLICPTAYGYRGGTQGGGDYAYPYSISPSSTKVDNTIPNGKVKISMAPYTEVIDANKGIIALDGTGAQGYGIQLAWGDYSSQNEIEPANPVVLNSYVSANSLNSGFGAGDTPIGGNAFNGTDNTIKMAARYVRTTGETAPGPANAVVQVIANYE